MIKKHSKTTEYEGVRRTRYKVIDDENSIFERECEPTDDIFFVPEEALDRRDNNRRNSDRRNGDRRVADRRTIDRRSMADRRTGEQEEEVSKYSFLKLFENNKWKIIAAIIPILGSTVSFVFSMYESIKDLQYNTNTMIEKITILQNNNAEQAKIIKEHEQHLISIDETLIQLYKNKK